MRVNNHDLSRGETGGAERDTFQSPRMFFWDRNPQSGCEGRESCRPSLSPTLRVTLKGGMGLWGYARKGATIKRCEAGNFFCKMSAGAHNWGKT